MLMRIAYFCFGIGSGYLVRAASVFFALKRNNIDCEFFALTDCRYNHVVKPFFKHIFINPQPETLFKQDRKTELYLNLKKLSPDILIVDCVWVPIYPILDDFDFNKILLIRKVSEKWLSVPLPGGEIININPEDYTMAYSVEPNFTLPGFGELNPIVIRNPDEIMTRDMVLKRLKVPTKKKFCLVAHNGIEGEIDRLIKEAGQLPSEYYVKITTNKDGKGIFPLADYAMGIDLLIAGSGYSTFYETRYLKIPAILKPFNRNNDDLAWRIKVNKNYNFKINGADQLVDKIMQL
jgi:hypothetical protein